MLLSKKRTDYTILITNDDGIESPGLRAAVHAVKHLGQITIVAPTTQQTGTSRSLIGKRNVALSTKKYIVNDIDISAYHCDCTPALIIRHCLKTMFVKKRPDLVISGINYGENLGINSTASGTIGAALEAASFGIPTIAISKQTDIESHLKYTDQNWRPSVHHLNYFANSLLKKRMSFDVDLLKIDIPYNASPETKWRTTKLSRNIYYQKSYDQPSISCKISDMRTKIILNKDITEEDSDIYAIAVDKIVSVTPLSLDYTSRINLQDLQEKLL